MKTQSSFKTAMIAAEKSDYTNQKKYIDTLKKVNDGYIKHKTDYDNNLKVNLKNS